MYCTKKGPGNKIVQNVPVFFSVNCAWCNKKVKSMVDNGNYVKAGIFSLKETHFKRKGRLNAKFPNFHLFETIKKRKKLGGTLIGAHKSLDPILIEEYSEDFELLVIDVRINGKHIRTMTGYGYQGIKLLMKKCNFLKPLRRKSSRLNLVINIYTFKWMEIENWAQT